jgi:16S rRNA (guanine966-N2)-methyltransferase
MRITGGGARGIPLAAPKGDFVRPATDAMRQAVFSSIASRVAGARFLDLFAGSGAYGLEAVSRGAAGGVFVESNPKAAACIRDNIAAVCKSLRREQAGIEVVQRDVLTVGPQLGDPPDLVFIDPPYDLIEGMAPLLFSRLTPWLADKPDPVVIFEMPGGQSVSPENWTCVKRLGKGARQPSACFFRANRALTSAG